MQLEHELPLVTIVSPCYNHSEYVVESLDSIRAQTYKNIEHIIIDDCSTDDSVYKIEEWIKLHDHKCIFIKHQTNKGISFTNNESILISKGKYWCGLATDDIAMPDRTIEFLKFFYAHPQYNMVCSDCLLIDKDSNPVERNGTSSFLAHYTRSRKPALKKEDIGTFKSLISGNYIPSSILLKKTLFKEVGLFDEDLMREDWDMWLRVSNLYPIGYIEKPLTYYRFHSSNTIANSTFHEKTQNEVLITLYKAKSYCFDKQLLKLINKNIALHIFFYLSMEQVILKKDFFKQHHNRILYYKILFLFYPNKLKLALNNWYAQLSEENGIKKIYKYFKYHGRKGNSLA